MFSGVWAGKGTMKLTSVFAALALTTALGVATPALAHHSFAKWDMRESALKKFTGVVEKLDFKNPHMSMTMRVTDPDGSNHIVNFAEGGPRNMLIRMGIKEDDIAPGKKITVYGAPHKDIPGEYFAKVFVLGDGRTIDVMGGGKR